ncbi:hypothetical protein [Alkalibacillus haloalkaliphilus]|uniref:DUF4234 domain-containing protein n=1 Tax=Alkalibacillus haloalkaliphilus TaxID=94136 RepID=A0A511W832_9BACI|nr:hypothetical protein [Alkalibacillus haloalkaliphilus]GEN45542.1 hypothetical protein AHA02nite_13180 [Alkalibacillus haloalkaliphilus]
MKRLYVYWIGALVISGIGFYYVNVMTVSPDVISGNGNLGLLVSILFLPVWVMGLYWSYRVARNRSQNQQKVYLFILIVVLLICGSLLAFPLINNAHELINHLGGTPTDPDSVIYRFGWLNQYTNSMFFNLYTFLIIHILAVVIGIISAIFISYRDLESF